MFALSHFDLGPPMARKIQVNQLLLTGDPQNVDQNGSNDF